MTERAVSDVIGFVLVFSLITATVALVFVVGLGGLDDSRDAERLNNAERAFDVLADNIEDIVRRDAPSRATEIKLADAQLAHGNPVVVNVTANAPNATYEEEIHPIEYTTVTGPNKIVYEGGAVIRQDRGGSVMNQQPPLVFDADRTVVPVVRTRVPRGESASSVGGDTTVLVRTVHGASVVEMARTDGPYTVTFNVTSPRTDTWKRYLNAAIDDAGVGTASPPCQSVAPNKVSCEFETQELYVTEVRVDVWFD